MTEYELRKELENGGLLLNYRTGITRELFEKEWTKTKETVRFTFGGWDGKSYDGESRTAKVYTCRLPGAEGLKFIKVGKALHTIDYKWMTVEKATGESHPTASWFIDVLRRQ